MVRSVGKSTFVFVRERRWPNSNCIRQRRHHSATMSASLSAAFVCLIVASSPAFVRPAAAAAAAAAASHRVDADEPPSSSAGVSTTPCPERCRCPDQHSTVVNCHRAGLRRAPFPLPLGTIVLDLDRNRISILANESFASVSTSVSGDDGGSSEQLEIVSIQDNGMTRVESGAFASLVQLRILRLGGNRLTSLPVGLFDACRHLQVLDLHGNLLTGAPPDDVMYHVHGLVSLNVSRNRLTSPTLGAGFRYATQLGDIDLSGNDFPTIDSDAFAVMRYWDDRVERRINLSSCNVRRLHPAALLPVLRLRSISLSGNAHLPIDEVRAALRANDSSVTRHLETIDVSWNSAFRSSGDPSELFSIGAGLRLDRLTELGLAANRIRRIPKGAFRSTLPSPPSSPMLPTLPTSSSSLSPFDVTVPDAAAVVRRGVLRQLDLSWNYLSSVGAGLTEVGGTLERLRLTGNRIVDIDDSEDEGDGLDDGGSGGGGFTSLRRLVELDLSHNELVRLAGTTLRRGPSDLRRLDLGYNRIRDVGDDALPVGLETLVVAGNRLTDVAFLRRLPRLRDVDLSDNAIVRLGTDVFSSAAFGYPPRRKQSDNDDGDRRNGPPSPIISANFSRNEISHVEPDAFRRIAFDVLDLSDNRLSRISTSFGCYSIDVMRLDGNEMTSLSTDALVGYDGGGPRELYVRRNRLRSLPIFDVVDDDDAAARNRTARSGSRMLLLDVSENPEIGSFLERPTGGKSSSSSSGPLQPLMDRIEVLRAERTNLRRLPVETVSALWSLRVLDVADNRIEIIDDVISGSGSGTKRTQATDGWLEHLHEIDLSGNLLTQFPIELLGAGALHVARLADNPWRCDCSTLALCSLPVVDPTGSSRSVGAASSETDDDSVAFRTRCEFAPSESDIPVAISLYDLCRVDSAANIRCSAAVTFPSAAVNSGDDVVEMAAMPVSWKLLIVSAAVLTGVTVFPLAALVVWHFGASVGVRRRAAAMATSRRRRQGDFGGGRRTRTGGYQVVDETALSGADREDAECTQPL